MDTVLLLKYYPDMGTLSAHSLVMRKLSTSQNLTSPFRQTLNAVHFSLFIQYRYCV